MTAQAVCNGRFSLSGARYLERKTRPPTHSTVVRARASIYRLALPSTSTRRTIRATFTRTQTISPSKPASRNQMSINTRSEGRATQFPDQTVLSGRVFPVVVRLMEFPPLSTTRRPRVSRCALTSRRVSPSISTPAPVFRVRCISIPTTCRRPTRSTVSPARRSMSLREPVPLVTNGKPTGTRTLSTACSRSLSRLSQPARVCASPPRDALPLTTTAPATGRAGCT